MFFFFNDTATTEIYTLSLHDALPILPKGHALSLPKGRVLSPSKGCAPSAWRRQRSSASAGSCRTDRKSTRLNSSHANISYAVFCLKKKKKTQTITNIDSRF